MTDLLIPALVLLVAVSALTKKVELYAVLQSGVRDGLRLLLSILPSLVVLLAAVEMLRASGALGYLTSLAAPLFSLFGIPPETAPLLLVRPLSGSAALAIGTDLMKTYGVDSRIGRTAAVMLGSTETTFYTISVYFGAAGIHKTRHAVPAALLADLTAFAVAALTVRLFL
ncbi:MAG: nucleoside recognition domain-containing protein [Oscillospiraceae bacterium]|nr:nucleoside recognition domain-containing protein [Oscillospiraceae bacterium]